MVMMGNNGWQRPETINGNPVNDLAFVLFRQCWQWWWWHQQWWNKQQSNNTWKSGGDGGGNSIDTKTLTMTAHRPRQRGQNWLQGQARQKQQSTNKKGKWTRRQWWWLLSWHCGDNRGTMSANAARKQQSTRGHDRVGNGKGWQGQPMGSGGANNVQGNAP